MDSNIFSLNKKRTTIFVIGFIILECLMFFSIFPFEKNVFAQNTSETILAQLTVGNVYPMVVNVTINNNNASVDLIANNTKNITCYSIVADYGGEGDIRNVTAIFFDNSSAAYIEEDDNNDHYNVTCTLNYTYGDAYEVAATCIFPVQYYANNATWNCTVNVTDNSSWGDIGSDTIIINRLIALDMPNTIHYGTVNGTTVSNENISRLYNYGNTAFNLSLYGWARQQGDNLSMNCTRGTIRNISISYERYNLTASNPGYINLTQFDTNYTNLTSSSVTKYLNLLSRTNDLANDAYNDTYWRIYVPMGVAGTCQGNIAFIATQTPGT